MQFFDKFHTKKQNVDIPNKSSSLIETNTATEQVLAVEDPLNLLDAIQQSKTPYITELISEYGIMNLPNLLKTAEINHALAQITKKSYFDKEPAQKSSENIPDSHLSIKLPTSEEAVEKYLFNYYKSQVDFDKLVSAKQQASNLTKQQAEMALSTAIKSMSLKTISSFKDNLEKELSKYSLTVEEISSFIHWRLTSSNSNIALELVKSDSKENFICPNFVTDDSMLEFQTNISTGKPPIYTSEQIDSLELN